MNFTIPRFSMMWMAVSFVFAVIISLIGVLVSDGVFDIYAKIVYWTVVLAFLATEFFHFIHEVRVAEGG